MSFYSYQDHLESTRLITRFVTADDAVIWERYMKDPDCTRFAGYDNSKTPMERANEWIEFCLLRYKEGRLGLQALINKDTGEFIGMCGLITQEVNGKTVVEIGYHLLREYWGLGYATEAAQLFKKYGFENKFADTLVSLINPNNIPSQKVAIRNGMVLTDSKAIFRGKECYMFSVNG